MGHWQQIGRDNAEERERRAKLPAWRRAFVDHVWKAALAVSWLAVAVGALLMVRKLLG